MKKILVLLLLFNLAFVTSYSQKPRQPEKEMPGLLKQQDAIDKFWKWFQSKEAVFRDFEQNPDKVLREVLENAKKIKRGLAIEFEPPKNNIINVTVSADGDKNLFPVVRKIIARAPKIKGWTFVAFRQRMPLSAVMGMKFKAPDQELDPSKMKFYPVISGDTLDVIIYTDNVTEENYKEIAYAGLLLVDNLLGEYDCVMKIRGYDFQNMPTDNAELNELKPLLSLTEFVDNFYKSTHH